MLLKLKISQGVYSRSLNYHANIILPSLPPPKLAPSLVGQLQHLFPIRNHNLFKAGLKIETCYKVGWYNVVKDSYCYQIRPLVIQILKFLYYNYGSDMF